MGKWRRYSLEFERQVVERMKVCENIQELAQELGIERKLLYTWKYQFEGRPEKNHANYSEQPVPETTEVRLMREDNLLAIRGRKYVITTDSRHDLEVYVNLAARMKLSGINQLCVADLTYIRLRHEFVYLAAVLDAWSRRVVGWALGRTLAPVLPITALKLAIAERQPAPGLVHHSDRGIQYACHDYVTLRQVLHPPEAAFGSRLPDAGRV